LVGGLLALNPFGLRELIFADSSPHRARAVVVRVRRYLRSAAMGTAIMAMGRPPADDAGPRSGRPQLVAQELSRGVAAAGRQR